MISPLQDDSEDGLRVQLFPFPGFFSVPKTQMKSIPFILATVTVSITYSTCLIVFYPQDSCFSAFARISLLENEISMACHATKENDVCIVNLEYTLTVMSGEQQHFEEKKKNRPKSQFFLFPTGLVLLKVFHQPSPYFCNS